MSTAMTRFDLPETVKTFLTAAMELGLVDAADLFTLGASHGSNWRAMCNEVMEWAFSNHHHPEGRKVHAALCPLNDAAFGAGF